MGVVMVEEMVVVMVEEMAVMGEEVAVEAAGVEVVITATKMGTWPEIVQSLTVGIVNDSLQIFQFVYSCLVIRCTGLVFWLHRQSYSSMELLVIEALINLYAVGLSYHLSICM